VLLVAPSLRYLGGQAVQARRLQAHLSREPWATVDLLEVDPVLPGLLRFLQRVKFVRTIATSLAYIISLIRSVRRYDVVHAFSASYWSFLLAPVPAILVGRLFRKRVVVNYRSGEAADHLARWGWHAKPLLRLAHEIVVPSMYLVDIFARYNLRAVSVSNFLEIDRLRHRIRRPLRPVFLSNRNFEAHYNVASVLYAFGILQRGYPHASLTVAGDGPLRCELEKLAASIGLRNTAFVGAVTPDRMVELYDEADIYLNAPLIDNMPNSVIEAFAAGLPVVSSNAGGIPYIVEDGVNGVLIDGNDPAAMARAAIALLTEPERALRMASAGRHDAETRYVWPVVREEWREVYLGCGSPDALQARQA